MNRQPLVAMMMAMDRNRLIGKAGGLPWHIPGELAYFKSVTWGKPIIMGRKTYDSIGRALPGRTNLVVTSQQDWQADDVLVCHNLTDALAAARHVARQPATLADEVVIIGGAALCREAMPLVERLYLTDIDAEYDGDTWLDSFVRKDWHEVSAEHPDPATTGDVRVVYRVLQPGQPGTETERAAST